MTTSATTFVAWSVAYLDRFVVNCKRIGLDDVDPSRREKHAPGPKDGRRINVDSVDVLQQIEPILERTIASSEATP